MEEIKQNIYKNKRQKLRAKNKIDHVGGKTFHIGGVLKKRKEKKNKNAQKKTIHIGGDIKN